MATSNGVSDRPLKAVILAAGQQSITEDRVPIVLQTLGDRKIADYVIQNALHLVAPEDLYIVVSRPQDDAQMCLWGVDASCPYHYVVREEQLGCVSNELRSTLRRLPMTLLKRCSPVKAGCFGNGSEIG